MPSQEQSASSNTTLSEAIKAASTSADAAQHARGLSDRAKEYARQAAEAQQAAEEEAKNKEAAASVAEGRAEISRNVAADAPAEEQASAQQQAQADADEANSLRVEADKALDAAKTAATEREKADADASILETKAASAEAASQHAKQAVIKAAPRSEPEDSCSFWCGFWRFTAVCVAAVVFLVLLIIIILWLKTGSFPNSNEIWTYIDRHYWIVFFVAIALLFIHLCTRELGGEIEPLESEAEEKNRGKERSYRRLMWLLRFSYGFMFLAIVGSVLPFILLDHNDFHGKRFGFSASPIEIFIGCAQGSEDDAGSISCDRLPLQPQWLLSVGGAIQEHEAAQISLGLSDFAAMLERLEYEANRAKDEISASDVSDKLAEISARLKAQHDDMAKTFGALDQFRGLSSKVSETTQALSQQTKELTEELGKFVDVLTRSEGSDASEDEHSQPRETADAALDRLSKALTTFSTTFKDAQRKIDETGFFVDILKVSGGLVAPLYVVVLSLFGGAIGMTRKLPEIQLRAAPGYRGYYLEEVAGDPRASEHLHVPIATVQAREHILFQILQVITAPLIALVAYSAIAPESTAAAVVIGFGAGFASEPILLQLRKASDALAGQVSTKFSPKPQKQGTTGNSNQE